jgi:hypothetical protein
MYVALKGWNLHTETFETLEDFFNPIKNTNHSLTRNCNVRQLLLAVSKIFPRSLIKEITLNWMHNSYGADHTLPLIYEKLIDDESVPIPALLWSHFQTSDFDDNRGTYGTYITYSLRAPYVSRGSTTLSTFNYIRYFDVTAHTIDELATDIATKLKTDYTTSMDIEDPQYSSYLVDTLRTVPHETHLSCIWCYHFNHITFSKYYEINNSQMADQNAGGYRPTDLITRIHADHKISIISWNSLGPIQFRWVIPRNANDRSFLHRIHNYSTNVLTLLPAPLREKNELNHNLYGIELEVSCNASPKQFVEAPEAMYCALKSDASISGNKANRYEVVSTPATPKAHKKAWAQIFDKIGYKEFDVTRNTTNGMHIHVDLNAFKNKDGLHDSIHQKQFAWFFCNPLHREFLKMVGERDDVSFEGYTNQPYFREEWSLSQGYKHVMSMILPPFRGIVHYKQNTDTGDFVTLEVRLFKGIVSLGSICKNIDFVDSVFNFTTKTAFQSNTIENYLQYLKCTPKNRYSTLKEFLDRSDLEELAEMTRLRRLVWRQDDPEKVKALLSHYPEFLKPQYLETLNQLIQGAKFGLKNGALVITETNRSKVYDLDLVLQGKLNRRNQSACASS